jgi:hypothetical protein
VSRPHLHRQIKEQLRDGLQEAIDTRILVVQGLGGSGKPQLVLNYVREYREYYSTVFWVEAGQKDRSSGTTDPPAALRQGREETYSLTLRVEATTYR